MRHSSKARILFATAALSAAVACAQDAANYPSKPVRVVLGFAPGGATDAQARLFSQKAGEFMRQQFVVENRPGAAGTEAMRIVAKSPPDGYTLFAASSSFTISSAFSRNLPADPVRDFAPVSLMTRAPYLLAVHTSVPVKSVRDLIAIARARPGQLNFGGSSVGSSNHLAPLWLFSLTKIKAVYVPYQSTGQAVTAVLGGHIDATMGSIVGVAPHVKAGRLRALGITSAQRSTMWPEIATIAEQGVPGYDYIVFFGWVAPAGTPAVFLNRLSTEFAKVAKSPDIVEKINGEGAEPVGSSPEMFRQLIASEVPRWRNIVQEAGLKVD